MDSPLSLVGKFRRKKHKSKNLPKKLKNLI